MAYPIRVFEPGGVYFITNRCMQSRLLMRPSVEINRIIGGVLARAACIFPVELFGFTFASNHFHLLARMIGDACLSDFVAYVEANIARRVGKVVGWSGRFWYRRFSAEPVLDDDALVGRLAYIASHGVKEGLIEKAMDWPGLTCLPEVSFGVVRDFDWCDEAGFHEAERRQESVRRADFITRYPLKLAVPPESVSPTPLSGGFAREALGHACLADGAASLEYFRRKLRHDAERLGMERLGAPSRGGTDLARTGASWPIPSESSSQAASTSSPTGACRADY